MLNLYVHAAAIIESAVRDGGRHGHGPAVPAAVDDEPVAPVAGAVQASEHPQHLQPAAAAVRQWRPGRLRVVPVSPAEQSAAIIEHWPVLQWTCQSEPGAEERSADGPGPRPETIKCQFVPRARQLVKAN